MNIRQLAEQDLGHTIEDAAHGFGWPVTLTDPSGVSFNVTAQTNDISQIIDPDTGTAVSGRKAAIVVRVSTLLGMGAQVPVGIAATDGRPWTATFNDINGQAYSFKVDYADQDRTLGTVSLLLGVLR